jgi:hypothetical protein
MVKDDLYLERMGTVAMSLFIDRLPDPTAITDPTLNSYLNSLLRVLRGNTEQTTTAVGASSADLTAEINRATLAEAAAITTSESFTTAAIAAIVDNDSAYAPIASPTFTGTPAAPTAALATNTTQLATTAFVTAAIGAIVDDDSTYAPIASPTFTGTPAAPTAALATNTTQLATTAFVTAAIGAIPADASHEVIGPSSAVSTDIVIFDGTTGELVKDSGLAVTGSTITAGITGNAGTVSTISGLITNGTNITISGAGTSGSPYSIATTDTDTLAALTDVVDDAASANLFLTGTNPPLLTGPANTAFGALALGAVTSGHDNVATGHDTGYQVTSGYQNILSGTVAAASLTTGHDNIVLGYNADVSAAAAINQIVVGSGAIGLGNNQAQIGNASITDVTFGNGTAVLHGYAVTQTTGDNTAKIATDAFVNSSIAAYSTSGVTGTITTAALTISGATGSMAFTNGLLTSQTQAT